MLDISDSYTHQCRAPAILHHSCHREVFFHEYLIQGVGRLTRHQTRQLCTERRILGPFPLVDKIVFALVITLKS